VDFAPTSSTACSRPYNRTVERGVHANFEKVASDPSSVTTPLVDIDPTMASHASTKTSLQLMTISFRGKNYFSGLELHLSFGLERKDTTTRNDSTT
jgi:hypothetical protein